MAYLAFILVNRIYRQNQKRLAVDRVRSDYTLLGNNAL